MCWIMTWEREKIEWEMLRDGSGAPDVPGGVVVWKGQGDCGEREYDSGREELESDRSRVSRKAIAR